MVVFITGVGSGIGLEACLAFLEKGCDVIGVLRNDKQEGHLLELSDDLPGTLYVINADMNSDQFISTIDRKIKELNVTQIDVLINIAGVLGVMNLEDINLSNVNEVFNVNFVTPLLLIKYFTPLLKEKKGNIVNITSMSGFQDSVRFPGLSVYGASKAALASLTQSLAVELEQYAIHINALAIGSVNTKMLQSAFPDYEAQISPQEMAGYIYSFTTKGYQFYNGKVLPVAITNP